MQDVEANKHSPEIEMTDTDALHPQKLWTYWKKHHAFPSMAKLCGVIGMASTASAFDMVSRLKDAGYVQRVDGRIASLRRRFSTRCEVETT